MAAVEQLMEEFFNPVTCNGRKQEIERHLSDFRNFPHFSKLCLYFLSNSTSQYLTMFALSSLEVSVPNSFYIITTILPFLPQTVINQQWIATEWSYREELKSVLYGYLIERGVTAPHVSRNKYAKLLVDIAKQDWPSRYPNFFTNILEVSVLTAVTYSSTVFCFCVCQFVLKMPYYATLISAVKKRTWPTDRPCSLTNCE